MYSCKCLGLWSPGTRWSRRWYNWPWARKVYTPVLAAVLTRLSRVTPRLVKEKWELKYRMCCLKYFASSSTWLENNRCSSWGTSGINTLTLPFLQQKAGPLYWNLIAPQWIQLLLASKHDAWWVDCGRRSRKDHESQNHTNHQLSLCMIRSHHLESQEQELIMCSHQKMDCNSNELL